MRPGETGKRCKGAPARSGGGGGGGGCEDWIGDLPDGIVHYILGFLPAPDAVRTCALSRRWRHLWKSATGLRITDLDHRGEVVPMEELQDFVHHLLLLRGRVPLYTCELNFDGLAVGDSRSVNLWFRHAVLCDVRVLRLNAALSGIYVELDDLPLVSRHLVKLQLAGANLVHGFLDFSSCPVLEHLEIVHCDLSDAKKISSQSLKRLRITYCSFSQIFRTCIHVPNLLSLRLDDYWYRTPVFEVMPLLVEAVVRVRHRSGDWDCCTSAYLEECPCDDCDFCHSNTNCVLLQGLSQAENLVLIAEHQEFIFKRDLIRCPAFSKLKTLLLIDCCCVAFNFHGISCILRHSPVLEKLTLEFSSEEPENELEMKGSCSQMERSSAISKLLKLVEVKCEVIDERVIKVLKYLSAFNICFSFE